MNDTPEGAKPGATYYPALDGLRAVAVLMVFCGHYAHFHPGWIGVSIFFVLSGFLITGILFDAKDRPHRFRNFYLRRTLRIFPAYYAVWILLLLLTPLLHIAWQSTNLLWPAYLGNWLPLLSPGASNHLAAYPLHHAMTIDSGHFWTLCVEEQFYLIWPLVVFLVRRRSLLLRICAVAVVASPLLRIAIGHFISPSHLGDWSGATFLRLDEFLLGGFAALMLRGSNAAQVRRAAPYLFWASTAILAAYELYGHYSSILNDNFVNTQHWIMYFGITLADFVALGMILLCLDKGTWLGKLLNLAPLRWLGKISYGFYIYHELPHAAYVQAIKATHLSQLGLGLLIPFTGTLILSLASYYLIEQPFLKLKTRFQS